MLKGTNDGDVRIRLTFLAGDGSAAGGVVEETLSPGGFKHIHDVLSQEEQESTAISFTGAAGFDV